MDLLQQYFRSHRCVLLAISFFSNLLLFICWIALIVCYMLGINSRWSEVIYALGGRNNMWQADGSFFFLSEWVLRALMRVKQLHNFRVVREYSTCFVCLTRHRLFYTYFLNAPHRRWNKKTDRVPTAKLNPWFITLNHNSRNIYQMSA